MNKVVFKQELAPKIIRIVLQAPVIAKKALPGEFVVVVVDEKGERIPLTIVDADIKKGEISLIFQEIGKGTLRLGSLQVGDKVFGLLGPLGKPTEIRKLGTVITVGGGVGIAEVYPVTRAFKQAKNTVFSIIGVRNKSLLILEDRMREVSDELFITTDDGSYARKGLVSEVLKELISSEKIDLVYAVGPVPMMRAVSELTKPDKIKTLVSLNPIMVDATGMCGSCRVSVDGETKFGCVDGPEFNAHAVDFEQLQMRLKQFCCQEKQALRSIKKR